MQPVNSLIVYDVNLAVQQAKQASEIVRVLRAEVLRQDIDYGVIPGTGKKPSLLKPGAERLCSAFGLSPEFEPVSKVEQWDADHPMFNYQYRCRLVHIDSGKTVATGIGSCNSMESKYRYRNAERVCPNCGKPAIIKGKAEYGGGWICFEKKGGCKAKFADNDPQITDQQVGKVENKDIFDQVNTLDKMAQKRALIAATLIGCNASEFFTQDIEDIKSFAATDDVIDADIIEETTPQQPPTQPPAEQPASNGKPANGHQAWYSVPENMKTVRSWLADREFTVEAAVRLVDKPLTDFASGNDFIKAVESAISKPAQPKNPPPAKTTTPNSGAAPAWTDDRDENIALSEFVGRFDHTVIDALKDMGIADWKAFATREKAEIAIRTFAFEHCWSMTTDKAEYKELTDGKKAIVFLTPNHLTWWKGRHELVNTLATVSTDRELWNAVADWELGEHDLPEKVRIIPTKEGDRLVIGRIELALPF